MKNTPLFYILFLILCVLSPCFTGETVETKSFRRTSDTSINPQPRQGAMIGNSRLNMQFLYIEPGNFLMGSMETAEELAKKYIASETVFKGEKQHEVGLTKGFYMQTTEVTVGQFKQFVQEEKYKTDAEKYGGAWIFTGTEIKKVKDANWRNPYFEQGDNCPVTCISWNDAKAFCEWLNKISTNRLGIHRLPTEAEWEYACRAGENGVFQWGNEPDNGKGWCNVSDLSLMDKMAKGTDLNNTQDILFQWEDGYIFTSPVGKFRANKWGLYDMTGNVWEWCEDWYDEDFYDRENAKKDPYNESFTEEKLRVLRGGSWFDTPASCRSADRNLYVPGSASCTTGFRVILDPNAGERFQSVGTEQTNKGGKEQSSSALQKALIKGRNSFLVTGVYKTIFLPGSRINSRTFGGGFRAFPLTSADMVGIGGNENLYVVIQAAKYEDRAIIPKFEIKNLFGNTLGSLHAYAYATDFRQINKSKAFTLRPDMARLKDQNSVNVFNMFQSGQIFRHQNEVLLIFTGSWISLQGLYLMTNDIAIPLSSK